MHPILSLKIPGVSPGSARSTGMKSSISGFSTGESLQASKDPIHAISNEPLLLTGKTSSPPKYSNSRSFRAP